MSSIYMTFLIDKTPEIFWSVVKDSTIWTLLGPTIFHASFHHVGTQWELNTVSATQNDKGFDFRQSRFLAYYTLHMTTFILGWILFVLRFAPDTLDLVNFVSGKIHNAALPLRAIVFGPLNIVIFGLGIDLFWLHPKFVDPTLIETYRSHNAPNTNEARGDVLGPKKPPKCLFTKYRFIFLLISLISATAYPLFAP